MSEIIKDVTKDGMITKFELISETAFNVLRSQDISSILDKNKDDQNDSSFNNGFTSSGDMKHVARIPLIVLEMWAKEAGLRKKDIYSKKMSDIIVKKLNDPDNKFLRTGLGEV